MVSLKIDNRNLLNWANFSYLLDNYSSWSSTVYIINPQSFAVDNYVIIGEIWSETTELLRIASVSSAGALTFKDQSWTTVSTSFAHAESTRVTIVPYNKVVFYFTLTETFSNSIALTAPINITVDNFYTKYDDLVNSFWYGWWVFYNEATAVYSQPTNSIPYTDFDKNSTKKAFDMFFSTINNKELKYITYDDAFWWANEGYCDLRNQLNISNDEYGASVEITLPIKAGVQEYDLPDDFSDLSSISTGNWQQLSVVSFRNVPQAEAPMYLSFFYQNYPKYYIRWHKIGFVPIPKEDTSYIYRYVNTAPNISSLSDIIDLPNNAYYALKEYMLSKAYEKLQNPNMATYFANNYQKKVDNMKIEACKRDNWLDTWTIEKSANV